MFCLAVQSGIAWLAREHPENVAPIMIGTIALGVFISIAPALIIRRAGERVFDGPPNRRLMTELLIATTALHAGQLAQVAGAGVAPGAARSMSPEDYGTWQNALKAANLEKSLKILEKAADKNRTLDVDLKDKDGKSKKLRLHFEKK